ncbi:TetR family transcriptional regulator [Gordonia sp. NPDC003429]
MSPTHPPTAKGAATRGHLLQVAARVFAEKGYEATRFSELIAESGLTKGAFYFYFPSKAALAEAVIDDQEERWVQHVQGRVLALATPTEQLADLIPAMLDLLDTDPGAWSVVRLVRELAGSSTTGEAYEKPMAEWIGMVADILRAGQQAGEVRADIDATSVATVLVGSFDGIKGIVDSIPAAERTAALHHYAGILQRLALDGLGITHADNMTQPKE